MLSVALVLWVAVGASGCGSCGSDDDAAPPAAEGGPGAAEARPGSPAVEGAANANAEAVRTAVRRVVPATEEALIQAVAHALGQRDLAALQSMAAPEYAADLRRLHDDDAEKFWRRGGTLVEDVKSGMKISHREDDSGETWRVLVKFGNGREERMTFTRVEGVLKVEDL